MTLSLTLLLSLAPLAGEPAASPPAEPAAEAAAILRTLQDRYDATRSVRFDFTQRYLNHATGRSIEESGTVLVAKPGRMRWEYRSPEKLFVLKDGLSWFYVPEEKVVYRARAQGEDSRRFPALFLAGKADLTREYVAALEPGRLEPTLKLVPKVPGEDYDYLLVSVDRQSSALRSLSVVDVLGNVTVFEFRNEKRDEPVADRAFEFTPPRDVEVVQAR